MKVSLVSRGPMPPLRRPEFQAGYYKVDECVPGPNPICNCPSFLLSFLQGKEAGFFNKVIAPLLYFPFINYKELKAE